MYDKEKTRENMRELLRKMGFDVPDEIPNIEIIVQDEKGNIIKRRKRRKTEGDNEQH